MVPPISYQYPSTQQIIDEKIISLTASKVIGSLDNAYLNGNNLFGTVSSDVTVPGVTVQGSMPNASLDGNNLFGTVSSDVTVPGATVQGSMPNASLDGNNLFGTVSSDVAVPGNTVQGSMPNASLDGNNLFGTVSGSVTVPASTLDGVVPNDNFPSPADIGAYTGVLYLCGTTSGTVINKIGGIDRLPETSIIIGQCGLFAKDTKANPQYYDYDSQDNYCRYVVSNYADAYVTCMQVLAGVMNTPLLIQYDGLVG